MAELIERAELFNRLSDKWDKAELYRVLQEMPSVNARERREGKWVESKRFADHGWPGFLTCDQCGNCTINKEWIEEGKWKFCPHCGAEMTEGNV